MGFLYFSHDADAAMDDKMLLLLSERGAEGYGLFWLIVERLRRAEDDGYRLQFGKLTFAAIAKLAGTDAESVKAFVSQCIDEYELFNCDEEDWFWSESLLRRMEIKDQKRQQRQEKAKYAAEVRWQSQQDATATTPDAPEMLKQCSSNAQAETSNAKNAKDKGKVKVKDKEESRELQPAAAAADAFPPGDPRAELEKPPSRLKDPIADRLEAFFWKHNGRPTNFGKERKAATQLAQVLASRFPDDTEAFALALAERYIHRIRDGDKFWSEQPMSASGMLTHLDRIMSMMRENEKVTAQEQSIIGWMQRQGVFA